MRDKFDAAAGAAQRGADQHGRPVRGGHLRRDQGPAGRRPASGRPCRPAEQDIDQKERDIESLCMQLLLQQQPVARDLRTISAALKMISDMERIGDQAADIAEITRDIAGQQHLADQVPMGDMARTAISMVTDSVDSFVRQDLDLAQAGDRLRTTRWTICFSRCREELIRLHRQGGTRRGCASTC